MYIYVQKEVWLFFFESPFLLKQVTLGKLLLTNPPFFFLYTGRSDQELV
jgi:hypothetical protein